MSALRPERFGSEQDESRNTSAGFEGEIREFIRRDVSLRRQRPSPGPAGESGVENVATLIDRVSGLSVAEIDRVIGDLQVIREMLRSEGERVRRELTGYAGLSQSAAASMKVIADTVAQLKPNLLPGRPDFG